MPYASAIPHSKTQPDHIVRQFASLTSLDLRDTTSGNARFQSLTPRFSTLALSARWTILAPNELKTPCLGHLTRANHTAQSLPSLTKRQIVDLRGGTCMSPRPDSSLKKGKSCVSRTAPSAKWHELWIVHRTGCGRNTPKPAVVLTKRNA